MKEDGGEKEKQTGETRVVIPALDVLSDIRGRIVTGDALHAQRRLVEYLADRGADYLFVIKDNQKLLHQDIQLLFEEMVKMKRPPDFVDEPGKAKHGRMEKRSIWVSDELNDYAEFPGVGQVFKVEREVTDPTTGEVSTSVAYGATSLDPRAASAERVLELNRGHWRIEATHYILDWSFDEDRGRIRTGYGPENMTLLRRLAICLIQQRGLPVAETLRKLNRNVRRVLDFMKMTGNTHPRRVPSGAVCC